MPFELTRRSFMLSVGAIIPVLRLSRSKFQKAGAQTADQLAAIEARHGGRLGVAALDTQAGKRIDHRAGEHFPMCSTFKFLLVSAILSRVDANQEKLGRFIHYTKADLLDYAPITKAHVQEGAMTISALCAAAIEYSDNTAANLLLGVLGGPAAVTHYTRTLGDSVTRLDRNEPTLNAATPGDLRDTTTPSAMLADMKEILIEQRTLSSESRKQLEAWMIADTTGLTSLRAGLPSAWRVGDKTGSGKNGATNDIAICWPPSLAPILITAYFVGSSASYADRCAALAEVGRIVADEFS
ncbi:MAG TPA: class A beta-lactamase [Candidatus Acidoferrales bacterium]|nr:class A beta-lactamase [Candidatus Acidoferrales bacterium]